MVALVGGTVDSHKGAHHGREDVDRQGDSGTSKKTLIATARAR